MIDPSGFTAKYAYTNLGYSDQMLDATNWPGLLDRQRGVTHLNCMGLFSIIFVGHAQPGQA